VIDKCAYDYVINQICYHDDLEIMLLRFLECVTNQSLKSMHRWLLQFSELPLVLLVDWMLWREFNYHSSTTWKSISLSAT